MSEGIFFTSPPVVEEITDQFDFDKIDSVVDSAAGSGNFLIPLARRYGKKQFYAIEKNPIVFEAARSEAEGIPNLHYFRGDALFDDFPIPPCDLYLGNPPFVNYANIKTDYRERLKPLWTSLMPVSRGFSLLLGDSRGDLAGVVFYRTVEKFLKAGGRFGVILPNSLLKGNAASAGFRTFPGIRVEKVVDISHKNAFVHTDRACFYLVGTKGEETVYPLPYHTEKGIMSLYPRGDSLVEKGWEDEGGSDYPVRQGINTLGANGIFFFDDKPDLEEPLLHPLLRSGDVSENRADPSRWALLPYNGEGKILEEDVLEKHYPLTWQYLNRHRKKLSARKSRFARKHWYALFGIGSYTFSPYKVVWRAMGAKKLEAAVITDAIPNQAMHGYIACETEEEARYLCDLLNSEKMRRLAALLSESRSRSFAQPGTMKQLPIKKFNPQTPNGE